MVEVGGEGEEEEVTEVEEGELTASLMVEVVERWWCCVSVEVTRGHGGVVTMEVPGGTPTSPTSSLLQTQQ